MDEGESERIERVHRLKSAIDREIGAGYERGALACPNCPRDGDWRTEPGGWLFSCEECGVRVDGRFSPKRSVN